MKQKKNSDHYFCSNLLAIEIETSVFFSMVPFAVHMEEHERAICDEYEVKYVNVL